MEIPCFDIKEDDWAIIDKPEKEQRKLISPSLIDVEKPDELIILQPFVISILPKKREDKAPVGIFIYDSILFIIKVIMVFSFIRLISTENITIKPVIDRVVLMAFSIEFLKLSPKLTELLVVTIGLKEDFLLLFLVIIPIIIIDI